MGPWGATRGAGGGTGPSLGLCPLPRLAVAPCQHTLSWPLAEDLWNGQAQSKKFHLVSGKICGQAGSKGTPAQGPARPWRKSCFLCLLCPWTITEDRPPRPALTPAGDTVPRGLSPPPPPPRALLISPPDLCLLLPHLSTGLAPSVALTLPYPATEQFPGLPGAAAAPL